MTSVEDPEAFVVRGKRVPSITIDSDERTVQTEINRLAGMIGQMNRPAIVAMETALREEERKDAVRRKAVLREIMQGPPVGREFRREQKFRKEYFGDVPLRKTVVPVMLTPETVAAIDAFRERVWMQALDEVGSAAKRRSKGGFSPMARSRAIRWILHRYLMLEDQW